MTSNSALNCLLPQQKKFITGGSVNFHRGGLFAFLQALILVCAVTTEEMNGIPAKSRF